VRMMGYGYTKMRGSTWVDLMFQKQHITNGNQKKNGLYAFVLEGGFELGEHRLEQRDALGIWDANSISLKAVSEKSRILLIEVPMGN